MDKYGDLDNVMKELRRIAKELNVTIITGRQPKPPRRYRAEPVRERDDFILIDYVGLLP